jgi:prepilin peptidase CpaA
MTFNIVEAMALGICGAATIQDLTSRKVNNYLVLGGVLVLITMTQFYFGSSALVRGLGGGATVVITGYLLWRARVLGAGDVKLVAMMALATNWSGALEFFFYSLVWGSLLGVFALMFDRALIMESRALNFHPGMTIKSSRVKGHRIPFTVAILLGFLSLSVLSSKGVHFL